MFFLRLAGIRIREECDLIKAIGSRKRVVLAAEGIYQDYLSAVEDLLRTDIVQRLDIFPHHFDSSRLQHCVNVSYYSFLFCRRFGLDARSAARAGLLHDLFFYELSHKKDGPHHTYLHPTQALQNATEHFDLNELEQDAIVCHMWPRGRLPRYAESFIVCIMDKHSWFLETLRYAAKRLAHVKAKAM